MIGRFLCWLGLHVPPRGVNPQWSIFWCCDRCGERQPGAFAERKRKP